MMNRLIESVRKRLRICRNPSSADPIEWVPVCEESPGRSLSSPTRWLCAVTDIGKCRSENEDGYYLSRDCTLWIVADGMGGHAAGKVASALTLEAIAGYMDSRGPGCPADASAGDDLIRAFVTAQEWVSGRGLAQSECRGMGSTAVAGVVDGEDLHVCHVGDVRAYHLSDGRFRRLTNDHSWVWETLVRPGLLTSEQARSHPQRSTVTQAIGSPNGIKPELNRATLKSGDRVLLCSDGLWEAIADQDIAAVVGSGGSMRELASKLVDRANAAGGLDNITAILYEHESRLARSRSR